MPNKELGIADPVYDALRIRSGQSIAPDLGGGSTGTGGIENKIYVWHADGSTIDTFDPDAAGLALAIAAAASGDTIWLPSIPIALTAAITIPANVALTGISHDAILNFTGFAGAAIVLSDDSILEGFTLNHTDGIGFDASAIRSKVLNMIVTANQPGVMGFDILVDELWILATGTSDSGIYWSNYTHGGARVWSKVASMPAGNPSALQVADDGSSIYVLTDANTATIYQCTNPKAGSPTWTAIAYNGLVTSVGTLTPYFTYILGPININGTTLTTAGGIGGANWVYGEYNGTAWTWYSMGFENTFRPVSAGYDSWINTAGSNTLLSTHPIASIEAATGTPYDDVIWHRAGQPRYYPRTTGGQVTLRIATVTDINLGVFSISSQVSSTRVRGAHQGVQVYCVAGTSDANDGSIWLSDNGTSFSKIATWARAWIEDDELLGGGDLVVVPLSVAGNGVIGREYSRAGAIVDNLTGNFWSLVAVESKIIWGLGIVYG